MPTLFTPSVYIMETIDANPSQTHIAGMSSGVEATADENYGYYEDYGMHWALYLNKTLRCGSGVGGNIVMHLHVIIIIITHFATPTAIKKVRVN